MPDFLDFFPFALLTSEIEAPWIPLAIVAPC
jgi:hypothetical protein